MYMPVLLNSFDCGLFALYAAIATAIVHLVATGAGCLVILFVYKRSFVHCIKE